MGKERSKGATKGEEHQALVNKLLGLPVAMSAAVKVCQICHDSCNSDRWNRLNFGPNFICPGCLQVVESENGSVLTYTAERRDELIEQLLARGTRYCEVCTHEFENEHHHHVKFVEEDFDGDIGDLAWLCDKCHTEKGCQEMLDARDCVRESQRRRYLETLSIDELLKAEAAYENELQRLPYGVSWEFEIEPPDWHTRWVTVDRDDLSTDPITDPLAEIHKKSQDPRARDTTPSRGNGEGQETSPPSLGTRPMHGKPDAEKRSNPAPQARAGERDEELSEEEQRRRRRSGSSIVARRRRIIWEVRRLDTGSDDHVHKIICRRLDEEKIPVIKSHNRDFGIETWIEAWTCTELRKGRLHANLSRDYKFAQNDYLGERTYFLNSGS